MITKMMPVSLLIDHSSQASQSPVPKTHHSGAVKEEVEEQEDRLLNRQTEAPVGKEASSDSQEEDSELEEPPEPLQGPDQRGSVDKRASGGGESPASGCPRPGRQTQETPH